MSLTRAEARRQRQAIQRDITRAHKAELRAKLRKLREALVTAKATRRAALQGARMRCKEARLDVAHAIKARRKTLLAGLARLALEARALAKNACASRKAAAKERHADEEKRAAAVLAAEVKYARDLRRIEAANRNAKEAHHRASAKERRSESDDAVRSNLPDELRALFEKVKRSIKGDVRKTRTEAFLQYAEENPHEVLGSIDADADRAIRELEKKHAKAARHVKKALPRQRFTPAQLAEVPF